MVTGKLKHVDLGRRLRRIRTHLGDTQTVFATRFSLQRHDIANYERGHADLPSHLVGRLGQLGFNVTWLLTGQGQMLLDTLPALTPDLVLVNRYDVQVAAGHGAVVQHEDVLGSLAFRREWIQQQGLNARDLALVDVVGDSMEKVLRDGDIVLIDRSQPDIVSGKAYVIRIGDELLVKYLRHLPGGQIQVFSENQAVYPPLTISEHEVGRELVIIGRVVASAHTWS
jgi:phage repressor protein C with HTH and peptisase S24 domain